MGLKDLGLVLVGLSCGLLKQSRAALLNTKVYNVGALIVRIGFGGILSTIISIIRHPQNPILMIKAHVNLKGLNPKPLNPKR